MSHLKVRSRDCSVLIANHSNYSTSGIGIKIVFTGGKQIFISDLVARAAKI